MSAKTAWNPAGHASLSRATIGLLLLTILTGVHSRFFFSEDLVDQWFLIGHLFFGVVLPIPFLIYLIQHLFVIFSTPVLRGQIASHLLGTFLTAATVAATVSGVVLIVLEPDRDSKARWILIHQVAAYSGFVLLPLHVKLAALRRRLQGRMWSLGGLKPLRVPLWLTTLGFLLLVIAGWMTPPVLTSMQLPEHYTFIPNKEGGKAPFFPGLARTGDGSLIPLDNLSGSARCGECHKQIFDQWASSTHRFAASNDHYLAQVKLRINDVRIKPHMGARFCGNCHEPIALFSGEIDPAGRGIEIPENRDEGLSCLSCHRIQELHSGLKGNANYVIEPHQPYLFERAEHPLKKELGKFLIRSRPGVHKASLMKALYRKSEFCSTCHQFFNDETINGRGFFRLQNTFEEWRLSPYGNRDSAEFQRCQDCHMPLVPSTDPAAKPYDENGRKVYKIRDHRFLGANTARPFLDGDQAMLAATQEFLKKDIVRIDVRAPRRIVTGEATWIQVLVHNDKVGHRFPTGTTDMHDVWIELIATTDEGRVLLHSGALDDKGHLDESALRFTSRAVDVNGNWLYRRDMWNLANFEFTNLIFPKTYNMAQYQVSVPTVKSGTLEIVARLHYRKMNQKFTNFAFGRGPLRDESGYDGPHPPGIQMPITTMAECRRIVPIVGGPDLIAPPPPAASPAPAASRSPAPSPAIDGGRSVLHPGR